MRTSITQAYVERIFSVCMCGILFSSRRSSMQQLLEMHACLKLNQKVLCATGFAL